MDIIDHKENLRYLQVRVGDLSKSIDNLRDFRNELSDYVHNLNYEINHINGYLDGIIEIINKESTDQ